MDQTPLYWEAVLAAARQQQWPEVGGCPAVHPCAAIHTIARIRCNPPIAPPCRTR